MRQQIKWIFSWNQGGYNTVQAESKAVALRLGNLLGKKYGLTIDQPTLHVADETEIGRYREAFCD